MFEAPEEEWNDLSINDSLKETEEAIGDGLQRFPGDPYILAAESQLAALLKDEKRALTALQTGFEQNPANAFIAIRLAKSFVDNAQISQAIETYECAIESGCTDKKLHYNYGMLLSNIPDTPGEKIEYHLRRAFTQGDRNYEAQFWYTLM